jgi:hypothetical protein
MPALKETKNKTVRVMTSEAWAMNRASNVLGKGLALSIDSDSVGVENDVTAKEQHTRVIVRRSTTSRTSLAGRTVWIDYS